MYQELSLLHPLVPEPSISSLSSTGNDSELAIDPVKPEFTVSGTVLERVFTTETVNCYDVLHFLLASIKIRSYSLRNDYATSIVPFVEKVADFFVK